MILVLNCGSQSIKWKLFDNKIRLKKQGKKDVFSLKNYEKILENELKSLKEFKKNIKKIGHRVVFGGDKFRKPVKINQKILSELKKYNSLAPLHNPFNLLGIKSALKIFPKSQQFAVFDTEFYLNLPSKAYTYALPQKIREKYGFKKFGFHGISHEYVAREGAKIVKKPFNKLKIITCHLGGGASITAIKNGRAIDTSMGYSPMEGLIMMTRAGSIDPQIIFELCRDFSVKKVKHILNYDSGLKGLCGEKDMRLILKKAGKKEKKAVFALEIFVYCIKKYIGAYFAILGGCDLLIFTGSIGAGDSKTRQKVCQGLNILKNTRVIALKTDEELAIARKIDKIK